MSSKSVGLFFLVLILTAGCATQSPYTATGAAIGGGLGAITGAAPGGRVTISRAITINPATAISRTSLTGQITATLTAAIIRRRPIITMAVPILPRGTGLTPHMWRKNLSIAISGGPL